MVETTARRASVSVVDRRGAGSGVVQGQESTSLGVPRQRVGSTISLPLNDVAVLEETLSMHKDDIACVIVEPVTAHMGVIPPDVKFFTSLRELTSGKSKTMAQLALQYCLSQRAVSVVIPGAKTPEQVRDNAAASDGKPLTEDELSRIHELIQSSA